MLRPRAASHFFVTVAFWVESPVRAAGQVESRSCDWSVNVVKGRRARLRGSPREGPSLGQSRPSGAGRRRPLSPAYRQFVGPSFRSAEGRFRLSDRPMAGAPLSVMAVTAHG
jgi:hypothetical protein